MPHWATPRRMKIPLPNRVKKSAIEGIGTAPSPLAPLPRGRGEEKIRVNSLAPFGGEGWKLEKLPQGRVRGRSNFVELQCGLWRAGKTHP